MITPRKTYTPFLRGFTLRNLRAWRRYRVLGQGELAERVGVDNSYIAHLEAGRKRAAPPTIERIARALGITRETLVNEAPPDTG